jgi:hypothetical protein
MLCIILAITFLLGVIAVLFAYALALDDHEDASVLEIREWRRLDKRNRLTETHEASLGKLRPVGELSTAGGVRRARQS